MRTRRWLVLVFDSRWSYSPLLWTRGHLSLAGRSWDRAQANRGPDLPRIADCHCRDSGWPHDGVCSGYGCHAQPDRISTDRTASSQGASLDPA
jgi:hypothetical protein